MTDIHSVHPERLTQPAARVGFHLGAGRLDWAVALGSLWLIIGLHLDGWAHHHIHMESFFTPWHAVLYSGYAVTAASVGLAFLNGLRKRGSILSAGGLLSVLPRAYRSSLLGAIIFLVGGLADMTWHTLLGIEVSIDALLSPPHLLLALGGGLLMTGPLRAALERSAAEQRANRRYAPSLVELLPALLSLTALVGLLAFFSSYANPWIELTDRGFGGIFTQQVVGNEALLLAAVLLQSALLSGAVLLVRSLRLPFGALTLLFTLTTALAVAIHLNWGLIPLAITAGLISDGLARLLRPGEAGGHARLFAFFVPAVLYGLFFGLLQFTGSLDWPIQMWTGSILLAGIVGWLVSYGFFPYEA